VERTSEPLFNGQFVNSQLFWPRLENIKYTLNEEENSKKRVDIVNNFKCQI
jgi:hypothetical protein